MAPVDRITQNSSFKGFLPKDFLWGAASASHQIEGCIEADGKGRNVWDEILKDKKGENGEDACNSYEQWQDDVALLDKYACDVYRFSVSWARIRPKGGSGEAVNEKGIAYYSNLVDALLAKGIQPAVTVFHWDHPQALEDEYGSFTNPKIVEDFVAYAKVLFERLGDRVKFWITINEPHIFSMLTSLTYASKRWDHKSSPCVCVFGLLSAEELICRLAKHMLLCHAHTADLYRREFQPKQKGRIGITLDSDWTEPIDESAEAKAAAQRSMDYVLGFYAEPVYLGKFPDAIMKDFGDAAPQFSEAEWKLVKGSSDFFGLNHYGTAYSTGKITPADQVDPFTRTTGSVHKVYEKDGKIIGVKGENGHPYTVPWGFRKLLNYISERFTKAHGIPIIVTENGFPVEGEGHLSREEQIHDVLRQEYYASYLENMFLAIQEDGVKMGGYMAWSLLDNLEWTFGYGPRFGITIVDRNDGFKRTPKESAYMLREIFSYAEGKDVSLRISSPGVE